MFCSAMESKRLGLSLSLVRIDLECEKEVTYGFCVRRDIHFVRSKVR